MCDYISIKKIEDLNNGYSTKDYLNPHKNVFEYYKDNKLVTIEPDYIGYANGDIAIKFNNGNITKIRYHIRDEVWVNDTESKVLYSIQCVKNNLNLSQKEWELFLAAIKECPNYNKSSLNVDAFLPKPTEVKAMIKYTDKECVHNALNPIKGWLKVAYGYSFKDKDGTKDIYIVSKGIAVHNTSNKVITFYGSFGDKTKELIKSLLKGYSINWCSIETFEEL